MIAAPPQNAGYGQDFARRAGAAERPGLWRGLGGLWAPALGPTGKRLFDLGPHRHDGTASFAAPGNAWVAAPYGWALNFDGSNYVDVGNLAKWAVDFTLSVWLKTTNAGADLVVFANDYQSVLDSFGMDVGHLAYSKNGGAVRKETVGTYNDGAWHHVVLDTANDRMYVDGREVTLQTGTMWRVSTRVVIGARYTSSYSQHFIGAIAQVVLHERSLAPAEVAAMYADLLALFRVRHRIMLRPARTGGPYRTLIGQAFHTGAAAGESFTATAAAGESS